MSRVVVLGGSNLGSTESGGALIGILLAQLAVSDGLWPVVIRGWWPGRLHIGIYGCQLRGLRDWQRGSDHDNGRDDREI